MPKRFMHLVLMPEDGGEVRNLRIPADAFKIAITCLAVLVLAISVSLFFNVKSYHDSKNLNELRAENVALREQLEEFRVTADELALRVEDAGQSEREARLLAGLDPIDEETRRLGIGGPIFHESIPAGIKSSDLRAVLRDEALRLDNLQRQVSFQKASYAEVLDALHDCKEVLDHTPTICPIQNGYTITSGFGRRRDPFTGQRAQHNGVDFRAVAGTPVICTADGKICFVGRNGDFGLTIKIDHGYGVETVYCHLKSACVEVGQEVERRDRIGAVGSTGRSTGTHLHYEVRVDDRPVNPKKYILSPSIIVD